MSQTTSGITDVLKIEFRPIDTHPRDDRECLLAVFAPDGSLSVADRGGWREGESRPELDEVRGGVQIMVWSEPDDGKWWSKHGMIDEPTHWARIAPSKGIVG